MKLTDLVKDPTKLETHGKYMSPDERWERIVRQVGMNRTPDPTLVKMVATSPKTAYMYAKNVLGRKRFPEGEPAIAKNSSWASWYVRDVIKGRWPEREPAIAQDPYSAYDYVINAIKGRWPEREPAIAKVPRLAYVYAKNVIKGRFPEGEPAIATDPLNSTRYNKLFGTNL